MSLRLDPWNADSLDRLRRLAEHPSLHPEFEMLRGRGVDQILGDDYNREDFRRIAVLDGADVGFGMTLCVPTVDGMFASTRIAVIEPARRRGIGSALLADARAGLAERVPECREQVVSAFVPSPSAQGFVARHGFAPNRTYWLMARPAGDRPEPEWPPGVAIQGFEMNDRDIARFVEVFNRSWKEQHHPVLLTVDAVRGHIEGGMVDRAGIFFAVHAGEDVGFVRLAPLEARPEVAVLGVVPEWRGRGLGRALLRYGSRWLQDRGFDRVMLQVDGENERALTLYRQERFEIVRTRQVWSRTL